MYGTFKFSCEDQQQVSIQQSVVSLFEFTGVELTNWRLLLFQYRVIDVLFIEMERIVR